MLELKIIDNVRLDLYLAKEHSFERQDYWKNLIAKILSDTLKNEPVVLVRMKTTDTTLLDFLNSIFKFKNRGFNYSIETMSDSITELPNDDEFMLSDIYVFINIQQKDRINIPFIFSILGDEIQLIEKFPTLEIIYMGSDGDSLHWVNISDVNKKIFIDIVNGENTQPT
jgi:hypothetical protein